MSFRHIFLIVVVLTSTIDSISIENLFNRQSSIVRPSTNLNSRATRLNCSSSCSARFSFDGPIERPANCSRRLTSYQCVAQVDIIYEYRAALVTFLTSGTEFGSDSVSMIIAQQVSYSYVSNVTSVTMMFACFNADDCDWNYAENFLKKFLSLAFPSFFAAYRSLFFDSTETNISQCYAQTNPTACLNGRCFSTVLENNNAFVNRSCLFNSADVRIDVIRLRVLPTPNSLGSSYFTFNCFRNLCNNASTETNLKNAIVANASMFEPASISTSSTGISLKTNRKIFTLFCFFFSLVKTNKMNH